MIKKNTIQSTTQTKGVREFKASVAEFLKDADKIYLPAVSIDTAIFSFHIDQLKVLLIRYGNMPYFNLPGGYVGKKESLDQAALRILKERTGLKNLFLEQFYTSGSVERTQGHTVKKLLASLNLSAALSDWFEQRFISVCYYALTDATKVTVITEEPVSEYKWINVKKLPKMFLDHRIIVEKALDRLRIDLDQKLVGFNLMNETFTMGELQRLYEAIYQKEFDRTNFQRKILSMNILERLEKKYTGKAYKSPFLYRFRNPV